MLILVSFHVFLISFTTTSFAHHGNANPFTTSSVTIPLINVDHLSPSRPDGYRGRFEARMKRDAARVASLVHRLSGAGAANELADLGTDVEPVIGSYAVTIAVGSQLMNQTMVIDTGSDLVWVQCKPCDLCFNQTYPVFDPAGSTSFSYVTCDSLNCSRPHNPGCDDSGHCTYEYQYGDGSYTKGNLAFETLTIGGTSVPNIPIGCSHDSKVTIEGKGDGLLGLGRGSLSLVSQSSGQIGDAFTYCLPNWTTDKKGWLKFGQSNPMYPRNALWASLLSNQRHPSFYYIELLGLTVGDELVGIPEDTFRLNKDTGEGGAITDTGTTVTRLPNAAYVALREMFKKKAPGLTPVLPPDQFMFDTCYSLEDGLKTPNLPNVSFFFRSLEWKKDIRLTTRNTLTNLYGNIFCLAFAPMPDSSLTIIGSIHQEGNQITIDASGGYIGFGPGSC